MQAFNSPRRSQGFVIIVVLMVVFLMTTLLYYMLEQQHLLVRRIGNQNVSEQGYHYAQGINAWAERLLIDDANRQIDYLGEDWARFGKPEPETAESESFSLDLSSVEQAEELPSIDFGIEGLEYEIIDLQSRFNLNNLAVKQPNQLAGQKQILLNLLELLEVGSFADRQSLVGALVDWIDEGDTANLSGVESGFYSVQETPYYAADQKLTSVGELRYVEGFSASIISKLAPFVTALPVDNARVNINTVSAEVLASLSSVPVVDLASVTAFLAKREDPSFTGFSGAALELAKTAIIRASPVGRQPVANMVQANSQFFQINTKVQLGDFEYCMRSVVLRSLLSGAGRAGQSISVLNRQHDTLCDEQISPLNSPLNDADVFDAIDENLS